MLCLGDSLGISVLMQVQSQRFCKKTIIASLGLACSKMFATVANGFPPNLEGHCT